MGLVMGMTASLLSLETQQSRTGRFVTLGFEVKRDDEFHREVLFSNEARDYPRKMNKSNHCSLQSLRSQIQQSLYLSQSGREQNSLQGSRIFIFPADPVSGVINEVRIHCSGSLLSSLCLSHISYLPKYVREHLLFNLSLTRDRIPPQYFKRATTLQKLCSYISFLLFRGAVVMSIFPDIFQRSSLRAE